MLTFHLLLFLGSLNLFGLPVGDVALLGGESDADFGDRPPVKGVLIGVPFAVYLFKGGICGVIVLQFYDVDAPGHLQCQIGPSL